MASARQQLGWRALAGLGLCGVVVGFALPAIAGSLIRRERQQPAVRLLPAPRLPGSETQPTSPPQTPTLPLSTPRVRPLGLSARERRELRRYEETRRAAAGARNVVTPPPSGLARQGSARPEPAPSGPSSPSKSDTPSRHGKGAEPREPPSNGNGNGGTSPAPDRTSHPTASQGK